jgi:hypothetical protein
MIAACGVGAGARPDTPCAPCQSIRLLSGLPENFEAAVVISNAARQRQSSAGRSLAALLAESEAFPETRQAWRGLSAVFDWPAERAFDELLGRKVTIVARGLSGSQPQWALITEVSTETERMLCARLKAAPRGTMAGMGVLALEDGKYELVIGRAAAAASAEAEGRESTAAVLLGPGGDNPLMEELAPSLLTRSGLAAPAPAWRAGQKERDCDVVVLVRLSEAGIATAAQAAAARPPAATLAMTATLEEGGWDARIACSPGLIWARPDGRAEARPWSDAPIRSLESDSLLACVGVSGSLRPVSSWPILAAIELMLPAFPGAPSGKLTAVVVSPARGTHPAGAAPPRRDRAFLVDGNRLITGREQRPNAAPAAESPQISLTLAVEADEARRAPAADSAAAGQLLSLLGRFGEASTAGALDLGDDPTLRQVPLETVPVDPAYAPLVERFFGDEAVLAWGLPRPAVRASAGEMAERRRAWSVASLSPAGRGWKDRDAEALVRIDSGPLERRVSAGVAHPAALAVCLADAAAVAPWVRWLERVRWDVRIRDDGQVEGTLSVRMVHPPR